MIKTRRRCNSTGKVRHRDRIAALLVMATSDNARRPEREQRAYRCPFCRAWHLTSKQLRTNG